MVGNTSIGFFYWIFGYKIVGNYNIVDNALNFADAPFGNAAITTTTSGDAQSSFKEECLQEVVSRQLQMKPIIKML